MLRSVVISLALLTSMTAAVKLEQAPQVTFKFAGNGKCTGGGWTGGINRASEDACKQKCIANPACNSYCHGHKPPQYDCLTYSACIGFADKLRGTDMRSYKCYEKEWIYTSKQYCSANWANDNTPETRNYGTEVDDCKTMCVGNPACLGIAVTTDGTKQCIICTSKWGVSANAVWETYEYKVSRTCPKGYIFSHNGYWGEDWNSPSRTKQEDVPGNTPKELLAACAANCKEDSCVAMNVYEPKKWCFTYTALEDEVKGCDGCDDTFACKKPTASSMLQVNQTAKDSEKVSTIPESGLVRREGI